MKAAACLRDASFNKKPATRAGSLLAGVPTGIRTPVLTVKGWCPRPLDDGDEHATKSGQTRNGLLKIWWSQTGSNRRPLACHASALPAELWPRVKARNYTRARPQVQLLEHKYFDVSRHVPECFADRASGSALAVRQLRFRYHAHFVSTHLKKYIPMATVSTNEMKSGTKVLIDGEPYAVVENEYRKPGKGQATNSIKIRNLKNGRVIERTLRSGDSWELADVETVEMQYLYSDSEFWTFMDPKSFEQIQAGAAAMEEAKMYLKGEETCTVLLWNGVPLSVAAPNFVLLKITETDPGLRGDTSGGGGKPATLETGAVVRVPLFVQQGEVVKVDTRTGEYLGRVGK